MNSSKRLLLIVFFTFFVTTFVVALKSTRNNEQFDSRTKLISGGLFGRKQEERVGLFELCFAND